MPVWQMLAAHGGTCPACGHGIAANRSQIAPLPVPFPINPTCASYYAERGCWLIHNAPAKRLHAREWAHARCVDKLDAKYTPEEQVLLAGDWRAELAEIKRAALKAAGCRRGRSQRSKAAA